MNVAEYLVRAATLYGNRTAICIGTRPICTYSELRHRVTVFATVLRSRGVKKGDRVLLFLENRPEYIDAMFAAWWLGASIVPVNVKYHPKELAYIWEHSGASLSIISENTAGTCAEAWRIAGQSANYLNVDDALRFPAADVGENPEPMWPGDTAWLFYTSGTTGKPKGAMLSHGGLRFASMNVRSDFDASMPDDTLFHAAPMSHGSGLCVIAYMVGGACHVIPESRGFDPDEIHQLVRVYKNCCLFAPPTLVHRMTISSEDSPAENIKTILYGGGPMHFATLTAAMERFGSTLIQLYAQGECAMTITVLPKWAHSDVKGSRYQERMKSVGLPSMGAEVRIFDENNRPLPHGTVGEIAVRSPAMMTGYLADPKATNEAIVDGWLKTGDIGIFDSDGFLYLKDRSKEMIISGGTNIYTKEVEDVILQHPSVTQAAVVAKSDRDWGEIPVAFVVAKDAARISLQDLDKHCLDNLSRFKRPKYYKIVEMLPVNGHGKILKRELREQIASDPNFTFDFDISERQ